MGNGNELASKLPPLAGASTGKASKTKTRRGKFLSTRRGSITLAVLAAIAALGVLLLFISKYRESVNAGASDIQVLVAAENLDVGTSGDVIAEAGLFRSQTITDDDALDGALTDPSALDGHVVTEEITQGQQLTESMLAGTSDPVVGKLDGVQRAITVPVGQAPGSIGTIEAGSKVDVLAVPESGDLTDVGSGRVLARDLTVLRVPDEDASTTSGEEDAMAVLRATDVEGARIAGATSCCKIWLLVRAPTLSDDTQPATDDAGGA